MKTIRWFMNKYTDDDISAHSAQVSFFVMISFFPLLLFLLTLIQHTPITESMILNGVNAVIPSQLNNLISSWIKEIFQHSSGTLISFSVIAALWAGSKGFLGIIAGIQKINGIKETRNFLQLRFFSIVYTVILSALLITSMVVLVYGNQIFLLIEKFLFQDTWSLSSLFSFRALIGLALFMLFFLYLYMILPSKKMSFKSQLPGAFCASIFWVGFSYLYSIYIDYFAHPASLYGSLAYIVLFMLWLFVCCNIIFIGAIINIYLKEFPGIRKRLSISNLWKSRHSKK